MFSLRYRDQQASLDKHLQWCKRTISFFENANSYPANKYLAWLHQLGDGVFTYSAEAMLLKVDDLLSLFCDGVEDDRVLLGSLITANSLCWNVKKIDKVPHVYLTFSWPEQFSNFKELLINPNDSGSSIDIVVELNRLGVWASVQSLIGPSLRSEFISRVKSFFDPDKEISIPISFFCVDGEFQEFLTKSTEIFNYSKLIPRSGVWNAYEMVNSVSNSVCPYCNRSFTHSVFDKEIGFGRPELDHFLPKSIFPFFAVSFFNLIPVCHSCNHAKSDQCVIENPGGNFEYTLLHPNVEGDSVDSIDVFCTKNQGDLIDYLTQNDASLSGKLMLTPASKLNKKLINSLLTYKLASINEQGELVGYYGYHHKDIERLLDMVKNYPVTAIQGVAELLGESEANLKNNFIDLILSTDPSEEPLGKLKNDILRGVVESWAQ